MNRMDDASVVDASELYSETGRSYGGFACAALLVIVCPTGLAFEPKRRLRAVRGWWCAVAARFHRAPTSMKQAGDEPGLRRALRALLELVTHLASGEHPVADSL